MVRPCDRTTGKNAGDYEFKVNLFIRLFISGIEVALYVRQIPFWLAPGMRRSHVCYIVYPPILETCKNNKGFFSRGELNDQQLR